MLQPLAVLLGVTRGAAAGDWGRAREGQDGIRGGWKRSTRRKGRMGSWWREMVGWRGRGVGRGLGPPSPPRAWREKCPSPPCRRRTPVASFPSNPVNGGTLVAGALPPMGTGQRPGRCNRQPCHPVARAYDRECVHAPRRQARQDGNGGSGRRRPVPPHHPRPSPLRPTPSAPFPPAGHGRCRCRARRHATQPRCARLPHRAVGQPNGGHGGGRPAHRRPSRSGGPVPQHRALAPPWRWTHPSCGHGFLGPAAPLTSPISISTPAFFFRRRWERDGVGRGGGGVWSGDTPSSSVVAHRGGAGLRLDAGGRWTSRTQLIKWPVIWGGADLP